MIIASDFGQSIYDFIQNFMLNLKLLSELNYILVVFDKLQF